LPTTVDGHSRDPDVDRGENPHQLLLASDDRSDLIGLELHYGEASYFSMIEPSTQVAALSRRR
jgi:hypothetical protein